MKLVSQALITLGLIVGAIHIANAADPPACCKKSCKPACAKCCSDGKCKKDCCTKDCCDGGSCGTPGKACCGK